MLTIKHKENKMKTLKLPELVAKILKQSVAQYLVLVAFVGIFGTVGIIELNGSRAASLPSVVTTGELSSYLTNGAGHVMCLDDYQNRSTNGTPIKIYPCSTVDAAQKWQLYSDSTIRIHGKCLDVYQNKTTNGSKLDLYSCNGGRNQKWTVGKNVNLSLNDLVSAASGKCLDDYHSGTANSNPTDLWSCNGTTAQVWGWNAGSTIVQGGKTATANCHSTVSGGNTCYYWVQSFQQNNGNFAANGVSANFSQPNPKIGPDEPGSHDLNHSVMEIWAASADGKQTVEIGWYKDNTHSAPILFTTAWVNNQFLGYAENGGTGFVQVSKTFKIGGNISVGQTGKYEVLISGGQLQIWYNGAEIGYFPQSVWSSRGASFTKLGDVSVYGEIATGVATVSLTQMGNGVNGSSKSAASVSGYSLIGANTTSQLTNFGAPAGFTNIYNYGNTSATGFTYGGPGF
jgi:hypothetical protein